MNPFQPTGPLLSFTGATTAPTSVQAITLNNCADQQVCLTNIDPTTDCVVGWGQTDAIAKTNAAAGATVSQCYYLLHSSQVVINVPAGTYFSGITAANTAIVKVQAGTGA